MPTADLRITGSVGVRPVTYLEAIVAYTRGYDAEEQCRKWARGGGCFESCVILDDPLL